jgi:hypothetical protein
MELKVAHCEGRWATNGVDARSKEVAEQTRSRHRNPLEDRIMTWKKALIYGSFAAGAALFFSGRRPAGLAVAGIGVATLAAEHPEKFEDLWRRMPEYIDKGGKMVDLAASFLERLGEQRGYRSVASRY